MSIELPENRPTLKVLVLTNILPTAENPSSGTYVADQLRSLSNYVSTSVVHKRGKHQTGYASFLFRVLSALLIRDYDLVHAHYGFHSAFLPAFFRIAPLVVTFHGDDAYTELDRNLIYRYMGRAVISNSTQIIAVSSTIRDHLTNRLGADIRKTEVIPCGIDTRAFCPVSKMFSKERMGISGARRVVLFIGRLTYEKGVHLIREASHWLSDVQFWFIGDGPIKWKASNCKFLGEISHRLISRYVNAADILVLPSRSEGTPISVLESLACETPVVCSRVGACPELINDGVTGILTETFH